MIVESMDAHSTLHPGGGACCSAFGFWHKMDVLAMHAMDLLVERRSSID